ncbi:TPA: hypothetical protein P0E21_001869 [Vibrio harveyi]|uniref:hypothetical protein n=1 Tax=Vibrio parahaemolyticus TaxID=670 RepID=UPI002360A5E8|nr:hypothetical protein [Vibrio parahaemolyticus]EHR7166339.1 hypothetical protein [Vibrio parahaemolyticus]HDM8148277.1 hypothetical protein [Vibrio harveyi]
MNTKKILILIITGAVSTILGGVFLDFALPKEKLVQPPVYITNDQLPNTVSILDAYVKVRGKNEKKLFFLGNENYFVHLTVVAKRISDFSQPLTGCNFLYKRSDGVVNGFYGYKERNNSDIYNFVVPAGVQGIKKQVSAESVVDFKGHWSAIKIECNEDSSNWYTLDL